MTDYYLIVAGGRGHRARQTGPQGAVPKQYALLAGQPLLRHSLEALLRAAPEIVCQVVIHPDDRALYDQAIAGLAAERFLPPVAGGDSRPASVYAGLQALAPYQPRHVFIHDAARPFITPDMMARLQEALVDAPAALPVLPVVDTLKKAEAGRVLHTVDRAGLFAAQTPQAFHFDVILAAHKQAHELVGDAAADRFTDDASIAEWAGIPVQLVEGSVENVKLTVPQDFERAEQKIAVMSASHLPYEFRTGIGYDVHKFEPGDGVILCGVTIPFDKKLAGHSDADVALHALTDAILGAIGAGDIGQHFPPSDPRWAGQSSDRFLQDAVQRARAAGARLVHVDIILICEQPKIGPHREQMRQQLAELLALDVSRVSVKATTSEGLGFTGRKEGIAAQAAATLCLPAGG